MKKILATISAGLLFCFTVTAQHIPDKHFADAIRNVCNKCIDSNNNLLPPKTQLNRLLLNETQYRDIVNIEGVEGFSSLIELNITYIENITSLPKLPASLIELWMGGTGVNNIESLPPQLQVLDFVGCPITSLPALPVSFRFLSCNNSRLTSLPDLPASLYYLGCSNTMITTLPELPAGLTSLYIANTKITSLPPLPDALKYLKISDSTFTCIPSNNAKLSISDIDGNPITTTFCKEGQKPVALKVYPSEEKKSDSATVLAQKIVDVLSGFFKDDKEKKNDEGKCVTGNCINGIGTFEIDNSEGHTTYKGSFRNGLFNGQGTVIVKGGYKYTGSFKDGQIDGKGMLTYSDGNVYTGELKKGIKEGTGTLVLKNGKKSTGIWKEDRLWSGTGFLFHGESGSYYGGVKENMADGQGVRSYPNGKNFTGTFSKGLAKNGKGYLFNSTDNTSYEGTFVNGNLNGTGVLTNSKGEIFSGNFADDLLTGNGKWTSPGGHQYDGNFNNNRFDGYGVYKFKDGQIYKGNWTEGNQNGEGSLYDEKGNLYYSGRWNNGQMANPENSAYYRENARQTFSRVYFKGQRDLNQYGLNGTVGITDEYHLNSNYTVDGTHEELVNIDGTKYRTKIKITGSYDPVNFKIYMRDIFGASIIYWDKFPDGIAWKLPGIHSFDGKIYNNADHPGYFIIKGQDDEGNKFTETDYQ